MLGKQAELEDVLGAAEGGRDEGCHLDPEVKESPAEYHGIRRKSQMQIVRWRRT